MATAAAFGVALFAPLAILGLSHGKPTDLLLASRPLGAAARGAGIAAGAAAAAAVVFLGFLAALPLAGGAIGGELRPRMLVLPARSDELRAAGSSVDFELDAPAGALSLVLAPRIGFAWGYGDPNPVRLEARVTQEDVVITTPSLFAGASGRRWRSRGPAASRSGSRKLGKAPRAIPEGSLVIAGAPMGTLTAGLALLARIACVLWLCACAAAAFSSSSTAPWRRSRAPPSPSWSSPPVCRRSATRSAWDRSSPSAISSTGGCRRSRRPPRSAAWRAPPYSWCSPRRSAAAGSDRAQPASRDRPIVGVRGLAPRAPIAPAGAADPWARALQTVLGPLRAPSPDCCVCGRGSRATTGVPRSRSDSNNSPSRWTRARPTR